MSCIFKNLPVAHSKRLSTSAKHCATVKRELPHELETRAVDFEMSHQGLQLLEVGQQHPPLPRRGAVLKKADQEHVVKLQALWAGYMSSAAIEGLALGI